MDNLLQNQRIMKSNRELIEQFLRFINTGDAAIGRPIISDDVIFYAPTSSEPLNGFEGYMGVLAMMRGAMADIQWKIEETISEGDKVFVRYMMTGTQTQPLMGIPATGKKIRVTAMNIYEFKEGKIIREHGLPDIFSLLTQLEVIPAFGR